MEKILIVEDDKDLNKVMRDYLSDKGYSLTSCYNGSEAFSLFESEKFDMIISDVMMPVTDGFSLAEQIRKINKLIPILFVTARDDKFSKSLGYRLGIDDYVVKPFDLEELYFKISAILRRANINANKKLTVGNLILDKDEHTAYINGEEVEMTVREFDLLYKFLSFPKRTFTCSQLMNEFWDYDSSASSRSVDMYLSKLREKTQSCDGFEILTVHGLGYKAVLK